MDVLLLLLTPALAFLGAMAGHVLARRSAAEAARWRRREETMRLLRWAVELGTASGPGSRSEAAAFGTLEELLISDMLDAADERMVIRAARALSLGPDRGTPLKQSGSGESMGNDEGSQL